MLRDAGAKLDVGNKHPLLVWLEGGSRECLAALIEKDESVLLHKVGPGEKSFLLHAILEKSALLPVIATIAKKQGLARSASDYPPADVKGLDLRAVNAALERGDTYLPYDEIKREVSAIRSPWKRLTGDANIGGGRTSAGGDEVVADRESGADDLNFDGA
jgi:hypothetical protein